jgi:hypothetical protein
MPIPRLPLSKIVILSKELESCILKVVAVPEPEDFRCSLKLGEDRPIPKLVVVEASLVEASVMSLGISSSTRVLNSGWASAPEAGPAQTLLAD